MKNKGILKVVVATIIVVALCTWIFPSASFNSTLVEGERLQAGIFDILSYPMVALTYFGYVVIYALVVGMFYGVANKIPAYQVLIDKIKKGFEGKELIFLSLVIILVAAITSVTGLSFAMIFVFPFIASVVLAMGYNKLVATSVTVGSVVAGLAGTTLGNSSVSYMNKILGVNIMDEMVSKVVVLLVFVIILVANVIMYAKKTKNSVVEAKVVVSNEEKTVVEEKESKKETKSEVKKASKTTTKKAVVSDSTKKKADDKKTSKTKKTTSKKSTKALMAKNTSEVIKVNTKKDKKAKVWPFMLVFDLTLIILALSMFDWSGVFKIELFADMKEALYGFEIASFPIFEKLFGTMQEFGSWSLNVEVPVLILISTIILALVYRVKRSDFVDGIEQGVMKAIKPAIIMLLVYVVLITCTYHPFQLVITKAIMGLTSGFNIVTMTIVAMISSIFNVDSIYVAQSTIPYVMSLVNDSALYPLIGVMFQAIYGLMMLVAPTSVILMGTLSYLEVPYTQWLKHIWKVFVEVLVVLLIVFLIVMAI